MAEKIVILNQGTVSSIVSDGFTVVMLAVLPWFNHAFAGDSGWIYAAIAFAWFVAIISRASGVRAKNTMTLAEARAYLDALETAPKDQD